MVHAAEPPVLRGDAILLMDARTGQVLYQENGSARLYPASTTKLLTALVAVERGDLDQVIRVSRDAVDKGPDSATCSISEGDEEPLEYLLYGLLLRSGNDCADAIAEGVAGGDRQRFIAWMNETARELGATDSRFANPHGLHDPDHYTTAADLAVIARAALSNPVIARIAATQSFDWPGKEQNGTYYNLLNDLLQSYPPFVAGKTGFTEEAGFTLAGLAEQGDRSLIGVTMGYESRAEEFEDMRALFEFGFSEYHPVDAVAAGSVWGEVPVSDGESPSVPALAAASFSVSARAGEADAGVSLVPRLPEAVEAPVTAGQAIGVLEVMYGDSLLGTVPLVAGEAVAALAPAQAEGGRTGWQFAGIIARAVASVAGTLALAVLVLRTVVRAVRRRRRLGAHGRSRRTVGTRGVISTYRTRTPH
ncbi:D-alanyl-D-alanine carboxypeptidase family protein [Symbiobacterium terraclitae]